jgi:hypothetical protein
VPHRMHTRRWRAHTRIARSERDGMRAHFRHTLTPRVPACALAEAMSLAQLARKQFSKAGASTSGPSPLTMAAPGGSLAPQARVGLGALARARPSDTPHVATPVVKKAGVDGLLLEQASQPEPLRSVQIGSTATRDQKGSPSSKRRASGCPATARSA